MYPCLSQRHMETEERGSRNTKTGTLLDYVARARSCASEVKIKSSGRGTKTPGKKFKTEERAEVKSRKAFKAGKSTHWQRSGKHQSGTKELMSRKRLQLAHLERQTKKKNAGLFSHPSVGLQTCASARSLCQIEQLLLLLPPHMKEGVLLHHKQN